MTKEQILLQEIKQYIKHQITYNPTIIKEKYGFKNENSLLDLANRLTYKM